VLSVIPFVKGALMPWIPDHRSLKTPSLLKAEGVFFALKKEKP